MHIVAHAFEIIYLVGNPRVHVTLFGCHPGGDIWQLISHCVLVMSIKSRRYRSGPHGWGYRRPLRSQVHWNSKGFLKSMTCCPSTFWVLNCTSQLLYSASLSKVRYCGVPVAVKVPDTVDWVHDMVVSGDDYPTHKQSWKWAAVGKSWVIYSIIIDIKLKGYYCGFTTPLWCDISE